MGRTETIIGGVIGLVLGLIESAYMLFLRVPSVLEIRPEIADAGIIAGLFGGRPWSYLYYHFPIAMTIATCIIGTLIGIIVFLE